MYMYVALISLQDHHLHNLYLRLSPESRGGSIVVLTSLVRDYLYNFMHQHKGCQLALQLQLYSLVPRPSTLTTFN